MPRKWTKDVNQIIHARGFDPDLIEVALNTFGPLPRMAENKFVLSMWRAAASYRARTMFEQLPVRSEELKHLREIVTAARVLLNRLGIDDPLSVSVDPFLKYSALRSCVPNLMLQMEVVARERRPASATLDHRKRLAALLLLLSDLIEATLRHEKMIAIRRDPERSNRGGRRRQGPSAAGQLIQDMIELYAMMRTRYPKDGIIVACDESLRNFIRAALELAVTPCSFTGSKGEKWEPVDMACVDHKLHKCTSDSAIRGAFQRAQIRAKSKMI
jgi:hypothetical protein